MGSFLFIENIIRGGEGMSDSGINDVLNNTVGSNTNNGNKKFSNASLYLKSLCIALLVLFFLSLLVLVIRIGDYLPNYTDIIFIEPKEPSLQITDDKKVWEGETEIEIFSISHTNSNNVITVMSGSGDNVIAPGMEGFYKFCFNNVGNMAIDYDCDITVYFTGLNENIDSSVLPFKVRLKDFNGEYVIGGDDEWAPISELANYSDEKTIGKNSYIYYVLEWSWPFESGNDELDTYLGNHTLTNPLKLVVEIDAYAVQSADYDGGGGIPFDTSDPRTGGDIVPVPYIILNIIVFAILAYLIYHELKKNKENTGKLFAGAGSLLGDVVTDISLNNDSENSDDLLGEINTNAKGEPFISINPEVNVKAEIDNDVKAEGNMEGEADVKVEAEPEVKVEAEPDVKVEAEPEVKVEAPKKEVKPRAPRTKTATPKKRTSKAKAEADASVKVDAPKKRASKPKADAIVNVDAPKKRVNKPKADATVKADAPKKRVSKPKADATVKVDAPKKRASKPKADATAKADAPKKRVSKPKAEATVKVDAPKKRVSKPKAEVKPEVKVETPITPEVVVVPELSPVETKVNTKKNKKVVYTKTKTIKSKNKLNKLNSTSDTKSDDFVSRPLSNRGNSKFKGRQLRFKQRNNRKGNN